MYVSLVTSVSFVGYEGLDDLAQACGLLFKDGVEFELLLVGNEFWANDKGGPIIKNLREIARDGGFEDWLIMPKLASITNKLQITIL